MPNFAVYNGFAGPGVAGAKVVVRKKVDNTIAFSGVTDASGVVAINGLVDDVNYMLLVHKTGAFEGVRMTFKQKPVFALQPICVYLLPLSPPPPPPPPVGVQMNLVVNVATNIPLMGATYTVRSVVGVVTTGTIDGSGRVTVPIADVTGLTLSITAAACDGVIVPLDNVDLSGDLVIILNPTIAADE